MFILLLFLLNGVSRLYRSCCVVVHSFGPENPKVQFFRSSINSFLAFESVCKLTRIVSRELNFVQAFCVLLLTLQNA
jgi:hypothetical protein